MRCTLNLTVQDPVKNALFNDKNFRIALSHAINRPELIDIIYVGQGEPFQVAPRPESQFYDEAFAHQYTSTIRTSPTRCWTSSG